jgi:hypothetical protein
LPRDASADASHESEAVDEVAARRMRRSARFVPVRAPTENALTCYDPMPAGMLSGSAAKP